MSSDGASLIAAGCESESESCVGCEAWCPVLYSLPSPYGCLPTIRAPPLRYKAGKKMNEYV